MKKYQNYKDTSIPWLPQMPHHWDEIKAKHIFKERSEKGHPDEPLLAATQTKGVVRKEVYENRTVTAQKDFHLLKLVKQEDFVISLRSFQGGIECAWHQGIISPAYTVFYKRKNAPVYNGYFRHLFKSNPFISSLSLFVTGIREGQNIDYAEFRDALLPVPSIEEQTAIANYLDTLCEKINRFIITKQKLIDILIEQKQAAINKTLKELNNTSVTEKLKYCVIKVGSGVTPSGGATTYLDSGIPLLRSQNIYNDSLRLQEVAFISEDVHNSMFNSKVKPGDVLLNITGGSLGRCFYATETLGEANVNQHVSIIRPKKRKITTEYLHLLLLSELGQKQIWEEQTGSGREGLTSEAIKNFKFPVPDISEQTRIVDLVNKEWAKSSQAIMKIEREIKLIKDYKQSLIAEAVTGKIDVRLKTKSSTYITEDMPLSVAAEI